MIEIKKDIIDREWQGSVLTNWRENILTASLSVRKVTPRFLAPGLLQNATDLFETPPDTRKARLNDTDVNAPQILHVPQTTRSLICKDWGLRFAFLGSRPQGMAA
jgi:hypothetical protein